MADLSIARVRHVQHQCIQVKLLSNIRNRFVSGSFMTSLNRASSPEFIRWTANRPRVSLLWDELCFKRFNAVKVCLQCFCTILLWLSLSGCSPSESQQAITSDANGFICSQCGEKICTSPKEFPTACPKCQKPDLVEVVGYYCPKDKTATIAARGPRSIPCAKCKTPTESIRMPQEKELLAWGAKKY